MSQRAVELARAILDGAVRGDETKELALIVVHMAEPERSFDDARFIAAVILMRNHQRDWFGGDKSPSKLDAARKAEREVDRLLRELASGQKALF